MSICGLSQVAINARDLRRAIGFYLVSIEAVDARLEGKGVVFHSPVHKVARLEECA